MGTTPIKVVRLQRVKQPVLNLTRFIDSVTIEYVMTDTDLC